MIPEWGSVEPLGFLTTLRIPAPEQVVHPAQLKLETIAVDGEEGSPAPPPPGS